MMVPDIESWKDDRFCVLIDDMMTCDDCALLWSSVQNIQGCGHLKNQLRCRLPPPAEAQPDTFRKRMQRRFFSTFDYIVFGRYVRSTQKRLDSENGYARHRALPAQLLLHLEDLYLHLHLHLVDHGTA